MKTNKISILAIALMLMVMGAGTAVAPETDVDIDIKPGSDPNSINTDRNGVIAVAILGSASFDVQTVDETTVEFGPNGAAPCKRNAALEDANADGFVDMVFHFRVAETGIASGDVSATLTGELLDGTPFDASDSVRTVPATPLF